MMLSEMMEGPCRGQDFPGGKKQCSIVETEFEVVGRHPIGDVSKASGDACLNLCVRMEKKSCETWANDVSYSAHYMK